MEDSTTNPIDATIDNPVDVVPPVINTESVVIDTEMSQGESLRQTPTTNNDSAVINPKM